MSNFMKAGFKAIEEDEGWRLVGRDTKVEIEKKASRYRKQGYQTDIKRDGRFLDDRPAFTLHVKKKAGKR